MNSVQATFLGFIVPVIGMAAVPGTVLSRTPAAQSGSIEYVALRAGAEQADCPAVEATEKACRVKRAPPAAQLRAHLAAGTTAWIEGGEVAFIYQGKADAVTLYGGSSWPMARLPGTELWVLVLRIPQAERAVISYQFLVESGADTKIEPETAAVWRGPAAPPPAPQAATLSGKLLEETLQSAQMAESRALTVYVPPLANDERIAAVVYLADGRSVRFFAPYIDTLIVSRRLPPVLLVGVHYGTMLPGPDPQVSDTRALEYLIGFGKTDARFEAHERYFTAEVVAWAESRFGAPGTRDKRAVFGGSNGGSFAIAMGIRHPEIFGHVIAFAPKWQRNQTTPRWMAGQVPAHYLLVGTLEPADTRKLSRDWADTVRDRGGVVTLREPVSGHDAVVWREWFPDALLRQFGSGK